MTRTRLLTLVLVLLVAGLAISALLGEAGEPVLGTVAEAAGAPAEDKAPLAPLVVPPADSDEPAGEEYDDGESCDDLGPRRSVRSSGDPRPAPTPPLRYFTWLHQHQNADGSWGGAIGRHGKDCPCGGTAPGAEPVATTALSLLALHGAGHTLRHGRYKEQVKRALKYMVRRIDDNDGNLEPGRTDSGALYAQALGVMALAEAYGMTMSPALKNRAQQAVDVLVAARLPDGGWPYDGSATTGDTALTCWSLIALKSAILSELKVPDDLFPQALAWIDTVCDAGQTPGWRFVGDTGPRPAGVRWMSSIRALRMAVAAVRLFGRVRRDDVRIEMIAPYLRDHPPRWIPAAGDCLYTYWGTLVAFQLGGDTWKDWSAARDESLIESQHTEGCAAGTWDPDGDPFAAVGGRVYTSAVNTLSLEIYYRGYRKVVKK